MRSKFFLLLQIVCPISLFSFSGSGTGTADNPFVITTIKELDEVRNHLTASFRLANDIDFSGTAFDSATGSGWIPIACDTSEESDFQGNVFRGNFAGGGHVIKNLYIDQPEASFVGLFGHITGGSIDSLHLVNCRVHGNEIVGGLAGKISDSATVTGCSASGIIEGTTDIGGLIGQVQKSFVSICRSQGNINGKQNVGGLIGQISGYYNFLVSDCYSTCAVSGQEYVGGIAGLVSKAIPLRCYATGSISGLNYVGGVIGKGNLRDCFATGYIYGDAYCGGVLGELETRSSTGCFWDVQTSGSDTCREGTGLPTAKMKSAAALKYDFTNEWLIQNGTSYPGLRCFNNHPIAAGSFDTMETDGTCIIELSACDAEGDAIAGYELVTQPKFGTAVKEGTRVTYTPRKDYSGYDFFEFRAFDPDKNFSNVARATIAVVSAFDGGDGSFRNPYRIATVNQLSSIRFHMADSFVIVNDLDFKGSLYDSSSGEGWMPIGYQWRKSFSGTIDGGNHTIRNLYINRSTSNSIGLFRGIDSGWVNNLILSECSVTGNEYVGGLTSKNIGGDLTGCHISGTISGSGYVGGITGVNNSRTVKNVVVYGRGILRCSVDGNVRGVSRVGGIAGYNSGLINECYTTGSVSGREHTGGLVGWGGDWGGIRNSYVRMAVNCTGSTGAVAGTQLGWINYCYFAGTISGGEPIGSTYGLFGDVTTCYWDRELCGLDSSQDDNSRTTAEMKNKETYLEHISLDGTRCPGWDFDSIWAISPDKNDGYPWLQQQKLSITVSARPGMLKVNNKNTIVEVQTGRHGILLVKVIVTKETKLRTIVYRSDGRKAAELINKKLPRGYYSFCLPLHNLSSGVYICRTVTGDCINVFHFTNVNQ